MPVGPSPPFPLIRKLFRASGGSREFLGSSTQIRSPIRPTSTTRLAWRLKTGNTTTQSSRVCRTLGLGSARCGFAKGKFHASLLRCLHGRIRRLLEHGPPSKPISATRGPAGRAHHRLARRKSERPVLLAPRENQPRRRQVPRSRECLHRGHDEGTEALRRDPLSGNARPHQADRSRRPGSPR